MPQSQIEEPELEEPIEQPEPHATSEAKFLQQSLDTRRRAALADIDKADFSWFHVKVVLVAAVGFFTDAYDIFAINIAAVMLGLVYGTETGHSGRLELNPNQLLAIKVATPIGTFIGQLFFGWLADRIGRKKMYGIELMIMIVATFGQALSGHGRTIHIIGVLSVWRVLMGVGIGGDYPLSAVIVSEFACTRFRGRMMNAVFAAQGWGQFTAAFVGFVIVLAYKDALVSNDINTLDIVDRMWRLLIGIGCVPGLIALYFRRTIPETPRFTMDVLRNVDKASSDINRSVFSHPRGRSEAEAGTFQFRRANTPRATWKDFRTYFGKWANMKILIGTAYSWFALDVAFYGLGLNTSSILQAIGYSTQENNTANIYEALRNICVGNLILSSAGLIPGYWISFLFIDTYGRKAIQLLGFSMLTIIFLILGFAYDKLTHNSSAISAFVFLYCQASFFQNFGPNTTTFIIPGEVFPTRYRSTAHGISAASGKLGAIIAQVGFLRLKDIGGQDAFVGRIIIIFAFFMFTGIFSTLLLPETRGKSLEELSNEEQVGFFRSSGSTSSNSTRSHRRRRVGSFEH